MIKNMSSPKTPKYPNLDIYFHMTNHYRKLSNVKSVVDTSLPKGNRGHRGRTQLRSQSLTPTKQNWLVVTQKRFILLLTTINPTVIPKQSVKARILRTASNHQRPVLRVCPQDRRQEDLCMICLKKSGYCIKNY